DHHPGTMPLLQSCPYRHDPRDLLALRDLHGHRDRHLGRHDYHDPYCLRHRHGL
ncbi:hypothetical protein BGZ97_009396, partial [Linnemannia gamsii]